MNKANSFLLGLYYLFIVRYSYQTSVKTKDITTDTTAVVGTYYTQKVANLPLWAYGV